MVMANAERISRALALLRDGLGPVCEKVWHEFYGSGWKTQVAPHWHDSTRSSAHSPARGSAHGSPHEPFADYDVAFLLSGMKATWNEVFGQGFGPAVRSLVFEVADARNRWAHQQPLSSDDTLRWLDSMERLLEVFGDNKHRQQIRSLRQDLMRQMFDQQARSERRRVTARSTEGTPRSGLTPWRSIIAPHKDVAENRFEQAEFAADLSVVADGTADPEYQDPHNFFSRTYITQGLRDLLAGAARRLSGRGGDPVIELQTNFGGGKTHSMIALYHLASDVSATGVDARGLPGVDEILATEKLTLPSKINRAVLVGQMISPSAPQRVKGGIRLHTLWGRLAYQLGGRAGYEIVRADDLAGTNPGAGLKTLFERFGPAVVLIDEWVAYARQLRDSDAMSGHEQHGHGQRLAGGDFDTQFTFAQTLTEAAAAVSNVVVLVSIPSSDVEVGGSRGRTALEKLKNVVARKAAQWQPASPDESFEIVRRRLFDPIPADSARVRDGVIRAFCEMYRKHSENFPHGVADADYRRRMELCYPIHPELFDRLFGEWSALDKFQRTRGVLRLMALAISRLWQDDDLSLLIMPGNLPMDFGLLVSEMKKYLEDGWDPVIKADVDGANSSSFRIDSTNSHFGRISAARRAARTVYMGSAPRPDGTRGVDIKSVLLGCAQPGESPGQFADALRRLSDEATHLYVDGAQYWYSLTPNVTRIAADRTRSNYTDRDADDEVRRRITAQRDRGAFAAVQVFAADPGDVPDNDDGVRLVILTPDVTHSHNDVNSSAIELAKRILAQRDAGSRLNRNLLVFLAAAANRLAELRHATRLWLAWCSIVDDEEAMNLTSHQLRQAESKREETSKQVDSLIAETFNLLIAPIQNLDTHDIEWQTIRVSTRGSLASRSSSKLASDEKLITRYSGVRIRMDLDRRKLWSQRGDIAVHELWEIYSRFPYMPRLANRNVLFTAVKTRAASLTWLPETFAYAETHNGERWLGLNAEHAVEPSPGGLLIHPDRLPELSATPDQPSHEERNHAASLSAHGLSSQGLPATHGLSTTQGLSAQGLSTRGLSTTRGLSADGLSAGSDLTSGQRDVSPVAPLTAPSTPTQFYAQFNLDPVRCIKQLAEITDNVSKRLGLNTELVLEIRATSPEGFNETTQRIVSENANSLGAETSEFE